MKTAIIVSAVVSFVFLLLGTKLEEIKKSGDDYASSVIAFGIGMISGCVFIALVVTALVKIIWRSL